MTNHGVHFRSFLHIHLHNFQIQNSVHRLHLAVNPVTQETHKECIQWHLPKNGSLHNSYLTWPDLEEWQRASGLTVNRAQLKLLQSLSSQMCWTLRTSRFIGRSRFWWTPKSFQSWLIPFIWFLLQKTAKIPNQIHTNAHLQMQMTSKDVLTCIFYEILYPFYLISFQTNVDWMS